MQIENINLFKLLLQKIYAKRFLAEFDSSGGLHMYKCTLP